jgi:hypothetical protein
MRCNAAVSVVAGWPNRTTETKWMRSLEEDTACKEYSEQREGVLLGLLEVSDALSRACGRRICKQWAEHANSQECCLLTIILVPDFSGFGGIAREILQWCHKSDGVVWWCVHSKHTEAVVWFFPSGRMYPTDERRALIRKLLDQNPQDKLSDAIKNPSLNPQKLLQILGLHKDCHTMTELVEEAKNAHEDSPKEKSKDYEECKLKIQALSQEVGRHASTSIPKETKDDWVLGSAGAPKQVVLKRRFSI